jgi:cullin-associated NEDD8-dissociated protein 1
LYLDQDSYSDDDDLSWKVRHSAAKCIEAVVVTQHDILQTNYYRKIVPVLIERFLERENTVKGDIFHCFNTILQQTKTAYAHHQQQQNQSIYSSIHDDEDSMDTEHLSNKNTYISPLAEYVPLIVRSLAKIMKDKDTKNREGSLVVLTNLVQIQRNILADHIDIIVPNTLYSLSIVDKTNKSKGQIAEGKAVQTMSKSLHSNLKITALAFLYALLQTHDDSIRFHKHIKSMLPLIISHANDSFYKIASEALLVLQELVKIIRPKTTISIQNEFKPFVEQIYECTQKRLKQKDFDQEVKERAITCFAYVIVYLGDLLSSDQLQSCWPVLIELLRNEITRLPTVRALTNIVESPLKLDLQIVLMETVPILSSYLRQNHRTLKMNTLSCLRSMMKIYSKHFTKTLIKTILLELPLLINENDLLLAQYSLKLTTSICKMNNQQTTLDKEQINSILNKVLELIQSPLLQGTALDAVIEFLCALVPQCISYEELVKLLIKPIYSQQKSTTTASATANNQQQQLVVHKQAFYSIAKSFAALTVANLKESHSFLKKFQDDLNDPKCSDSIKILALLCLGETGKYTDLAQSSSNLQQILLEIFSSPSDDLRTAASYTLGYIGIRNLNSHIPFLLNEIARSQAKRQYLLLHSLREIIAYQNHENLPQLDEHIDSIWRTLFAHCECPEEGTRNVVAECLGKLTLLKPEKLLPILRETFLNHMQKKQISSPHVRSTIITAIKFTIVDQPQHIDTILKSYIKDFLNGLEDDDIDVRRVALVMFNSGLRNLTLFFLLKFLDFVFFSGT